MHSSPASPASCPALSRVSWAHTNLLTSSEPRDREIVILSPNNQRQHRALHIQKDVLPYTLC